MGTDVTEPSYDEYVTHMLMIDIQSVNDAPEITHVGYQDVEDHKVYISGKEEHWTNLSISYIDVDSSEHLFSSNIFDVYPELTQWFDIWIDNTHLNSVFFSATM